MSDGLSSRPLNDTLATTGPGIADDALSPGETVEDALPAAADAESPAELERRVFDEPETDEPQAHPS